MKSDFISLASHQLRTPLSAIKTYTHMLAEGYMGEVNDTQKQSLRTIVDASNRMNELISTLLNVSRIESGNIVMALKPVDMKRMGHTVISELKHLSDEKHIKVIFNAPRHEYIISTDNLLMKEVVSNLISNAIKYTPENGTVRVSLRHNRGEFRLSVKDNGIGIPKFAQEQIFTKFFRADNVIKRETTGTGLGLYLVKNLIEMLGGNIMFESVEHEGSTFHVTVPSGL
jgi:signal transduction histidine kinase